MTRRTVTVLAILALSLTGSLAATAGPAGAASKDKTPSEADCKAISDIKVSDSSSAKGYDRSQLTELGAAYSEAASRISDPKLKAGMAALGKIYTSAGRSKTQVGALVSLGKAGKAYGKALKVTLGATMACAFSGVTDLTLPDVSSSDN